MVSLPLDTGWRNISRKNPRGSQGHRRYNLAFLASMLNGGEDVFAPGFVGAAPSRGQRVVQMGGTLLQLPKLFASRNATEINGPLSSYGPISVTIGEANFGRVFKNLLSGNPSIVVRGRSGSENPLAALCDYLGVDTCERMVAKVLDNPVLVFECTAQDQTVIVHLAVGEDGLESVDRHRDGLRRLDGVPLPSEVRALTSKIIDAPHRPQAVLIETRVPGRPIRCVICLPTRFRKASNKPSISLSHSPNRLAEFRKARITHISVRRSPICRVALRSLSQTM